MVRYAELYPEDVDRIFMLCPSFGLGARAQNFGSEAEMADWERTGARGKKCASKVIFASLPSLCMIADTITHHNRARSSHLCTGIG